jgi:Concanavalin A-like lectin/glucanases superfamily
MGLIVPRRFNATTSRVSYAANVAQNISDQTIFVQCMYVGAGEGTFNYLFSQCDPTAITNGIRFFINNAHVLLFGAYDGGGGSPQFQAAVATTQNALMSIAVTYDVDTAIKLYMSANGAPIVDAGGSLTGGVYGPYVQPAGKLPTIGNRSGGDRTFNGDIFRVARWDRVLSWTELQMAQYLGPESVPAGLVFNWIPDLGDTGPYHLTCPTITDIGPGATSPFVAPFDDGDDEDEWFLLSAVLQYARPSSDIAANGWLPSTGSDLFAMLDETSASDADYIYSPDNPTTQQFEVKLSTVNDPAVSTGHTISIRLKAINADTNFDLDLVQGTTVLDSWTENVTVAAGAVTRTRTLSGAVADSITQYDDLRIRGVARA